MVLLQLNLPFRMEAGTPECLVLILVGSSLWRKTDLQTYKTMREIRRLKRDVPLGRLGYQVCRARTSDELPWYRIGQLAGLELPRPIALVNGAFDILHAGHMRLIYEAADRARSVICALDSDGKVEHLKGALPYQTWTMRAAVLKYMPVSGVVEIETDWDFEDLCEELRPDFRVLSTEYLGHVSRVPSIPIIYVQDRGSHSSDIKAKLCANMI